MDMHLVGAADSAASVESDKAIYTDALLDTDYTVAALPEGVETFLQLRSEDSPEEVRFRFSVPEGGSLRLTGNPLSKKGPVGAQVVKDGQVLQTITPPAASDAEGAAVPVRYAIEDNDLILRVNHRDRDLMYPLLVDPVVDEFGKAGTAYGWGWGFSRNRNNLFGYNCVSPPRTECSSGTGLSGVGLYVQGGWGTESGNAVGEWWYIAPRGSHIFRVDWNNFGYDSYNNCVYGDITDPWGNMQGSVLWRCDPYDTRRRNQSFTSCTAHPNCSPAGSTPGNYARFGINRYNGSYHDPWAHFQRAYIHLWEGANPYFQSLRPVDPAQWNEGARTTRWLKGNETFTYRYNVHDDGLGLDWIDENNFGRGSRAVSTGACDYPTVSCATDYVMPENSSTWSANDTSTFPAGISHNWARAFDNVGNQACCYSWSVRVDRAAPNIYVSGPLKDAAGRVIDRPMPLNVSASDGTPGETVDSQKRAGVGGIEIQVDGQRQTIKNQSCDHSCDLHLPEWSLDPLRLTPGKHTVTVIARDQANNYKTESFEISTVASVAPRDDDEKGDGPSEPEPGDDTQEGIDDFCTPDPDTEDYCTQNDTSNPVDQAALSETPLTEPDPAAPGNAKIAPGDPEGWGFAFTGVGDMQDLRFHRLGVKQIRLLVPFDAVIRGDADQSYTFKVDDAGRTQTVNVPKDTALRDKIGEQLAYAQSQGWQVLVSFERTSYDPTYNFRLGARYLPSATFYKTAIKRFMEHFAPYNGTIRWYSSWNEPNGKAQPTSGIRSYLADTVAGSKLAGAKAAGQYWRKAKYLCDRLPAANKCSVVAGEFLDDRLFTRGYFNAYVDGIGSRPRSVWAFHPYWTGLTGDRRQLDNFYRWTKAKPGQTQPKVWFTEIGPMYDKYKDAAGNITRDQDRGVQDLRRLLYYTATQPRLTRFYYYTWRGDLPATPSSSAPHDGGMIDPTSYSAENPGGTPRKAYCVYGSFTNQPQFPSCP